MHVMSRALRLASSFAARWRGGGIDAAGDGEVIQAVERALAELHRKGCEAHPDLALDAVLLAAYAGDRARPDLGATEAIQGLRGADLFLACACAQNLPAALRAFERDLIAKVPEYLRKLRVSRDVEEETRQALREKLFLPAAGEPPRIVQYSGRGALEGWVRVAALRTALDLLDSRKTAAPPRDEAALARVVDRGDDPELLFLKESYRAPFVAAFREALAAAPRRARVLLHLTFVEGVTPERLGRLYRVHRTTAMRWVDAARAEVLEATRARLMERLQISAAECDDLFSLVQSRLDLTLGSLLGSDARRDAAKLASE
jgi:RNA polymerase sigma-70 factor (ECF subfamily)